MEKSNLIEFLKLHKRWDFIRGGAYYGCGDWVMLQEDEALITLNVRRETGAGYCDNTMCNQCFLDHVALYRVTKDSMIELDSKPKWFLKTYNPLPPIPEWYKKITTPNQGGAQ